MDNTPSETLKKGLTERHIFFIALGSAIGTGLFYGSGKAIGLAGPSVIIAYIAAGMAVFMVLRALGEMILYKTLPGSFGSYATNYLGPLAGFLTGWTYVFEMALVCVADITVFANYMMFWLPEGHPFYLEPWQWSLAVTVIIVFLNLTAVKVFGELEFWLSLTKVLAILAMIAGGLLIVFIGTSDVVATGFKNLWTNGGFMPNGVTGLIASFSVVVFAFGGVEIIGITASEAQNPDKTIPRAINTVPSRILIFYVMTMVVLMSIFPWDKIDGQNSPFVTIFDSLGIKSAAHILNAVLITAVISAINSDVYGAARMIYGLAKDKQAPKQLGKLSKNGVPIYAVIVMFVVLIIGVIMNYIDHERLFFLMAAMATFATVWVWLIIMLSHFKMRLQLKTEEIKKLKFSVPIWPYATILTIAFLVFVICVLGSYQEPRKALYLGSAWIAILVACYYIWLDNAWISKLSRK